MGGLKGFESLNHGKGKPIKFEPNIKRSCFQQKKRPR